MHTQGTATAPLEALSIYRARLYRTMIIMGLSALTVSAAIIYLFSQLSSREAIVSAMDQAELMMMTLMPYMISAVVAAITAIGVMTILADSRATNPSEKILLRLRDAANGNLSAQIKPYGEPHIKEIANEMNVVFNQLGTQINHWKLVNRQQWGVLCRIRLAVESQDYNEAIKQVAVMEQNWDKIAEIEQQIVC